MQKRERILDNAAQFAGGTASIISGLSRNIREDIKSRVDEVVDRLDLVPRQDLERLETIVQETRAQNEDLKLRIEKLEKKRK